MSHQPFLNSDVFCRVTLWEGAGLQKQWSTVSVGGKVARSEDGVGAVRVSAGRGAADRVEDPQRVGESVSAAVVRWVYLKKKPHNPFKI